MGLWHRLFRLPFYKPFNCALYSYIFSSSVSHVIYYFYFMLQVRGSIPFLWEQTVDLTYKPKFEILRAEEAVSTVCYLYCIVLYHTEPFYLE